MKHNCFTCKHVRIESECVGEIVADSFFCNHPSKHRFFANPDEQLSMDIVESKCASWEEKIVKNPIEIKLKEIEDRL